MQIYGGFEGFPLGWQYNDPCTHTYTSEADLVSTFFGVVVSLLLICSPLITWGRFPF